MGDEFSPIFRLLRRAARHELEQKQKQKQKKIKEQRKKKIHIYIYKLLFMIRGMLSA